MKLLEYEAKHLLDECDIPIPRSFDQKNVVLPAVFKSQVPVGGRGKAGGIIVVNEHDQINSTIDTLTHLDIKGLTPKKILIEEKLNIKQELYLSLLIDRDTAGIKLMAHKNGGVEVEDNHNFKIWNLEYDRFSVDIVGQELADYYELPTQTFVLQDLLENLYTCFVKNDATLIEINPLILTNKNELIAGDCKMTLDDAAAFRHNWTFEEQPAEVNFVTIDPKGTIATIANGAGLAMATVDAVYDAGLTPANFLDIGGGANADTLLKAFGRLAEYQNVKAIVINIFAGITRADEVAYAIIAAHQNMTALPPLFIRLAGTNYDKAARLLTAAHITIQPSLEACLSAAKEVIHD